MKMAPIALAALLAAPVAMPAQAASLDVRSGHHRVFRVNSVESLMLAAERGNARAQAKLGFMYLTGQGVPQDYVMAAMWFRCAAEQGNTTAQYFLGLAYNKGQGVPKSNIEAHKWLNLAAARGTGREREFSVAMRKAVATKLNRWETAEAQRRATMWPWVEW